MKIKSIHLNVRGKRHHESGGQPSDPSLQHDKHHGPTAHVEIKQCDPDQLQARGHVPVRQWRSREPEDKYVSVRDTTVRTGDRRRPEVSCRELQLWHRRARGNMETRVGADNYRLDTQPLFKGHTHTHTETRYYCIGIHFISDTTTESLRDTVQNSIHLGGLNKNNALGERFQITTHRMLVSGFMG